MRPARFNAANAAAELGRADLAVPSTDIMTEPEEEILTTEVLYTIVGGKVLYKR